MLARHRSGEVRVPPVIVEVVNGIGASGAFGGELCHGLLAGRELEQIIRFANAARAIVASRIACSDAMPTASGVDALLAEARAAEEHAVDGLAPEGRGVDGLAPEGRAVDGLAPEGRAAGAEPAEALPKESTHA